MPATAISFSVWFQFACKSGHVSLEPVQHRLRATLELEVPVPARGGAVNPVELLVGDGDVVEHRLHVARVGEYVVVYLVEKRRNANALGPLAWRPSRESVTRAQHDQPLEIVDAVRRDSLHGQAPFDDRLH